MTCEHCGADAVGPDGICQRCGWRAANGTGAGGETRAADVVVARKPPLPIARDATPPGSYGDPYSAPRPPTSGPLGRPPTRTSGANATAQFCGTCGARLAAGEQFCGQCGAPVFASSGADQATAFRRAPYAPGPYGPAEQDDWRADDYNEPTEAYSDMMGNVAPGYGRYGTGYGDSRAAAAGGQELGAADRKLLIVFGILCILGGLISGIGAVYLAFAPH